VYLSYTNTIFKDSGCIVKGSFIYEVSTKTTWVRCMSKTKDKIEIRMSIDGILAERLSKVKEYYQLKSYTDVIRFLITTKYEEITGGGRLFPAHPSR
jgi:ArsR family metal-binding transcriptional regulator